MGTSGNSYGVFGYNPNNIGVYGSGNIGVKGYSASAYDAVGVYGYCEYGYGILGESHGGTAGVFLGDVSVSGSIYQGSDKSLKQNIRSFSSAMDIINKLHATQYEFRQDGNYKLMNLPVGSHYGLIAQEVETVLPNLIKETKFDPAMATPRKPGEKNIAKDSAKSDVINFKALNYTELIPIMIKGMQELSSQNDSLKNENIVQEKVNAGLQNQINELKSMMISSQQITISISSSASLQQNIPNPFTNTTSIGYSLPNKFSSAHIVITDKNGKTLKAIIISGSGKGSIHVDASTISSGAYQYSLIVDGRLIDTKQMILIK